MKKKRTTSQPLKSIASFLYEVGTLRKIARSHRQGLLTEDMSDNIASHSFRVSVIGYSLAMSAGVDADKVVKICLFHDIGESRSGDQNWIHKKYVKTFEDEIASDQFKPLPFGKELHSLDLEYQERKSKEAKIAKDADVIDQILLLKEYAWAGNQEAATWLKHENHLKILLTKEGKALAKEIIKQKPSDWWYKGLWTTARR